MALSTRFAYRGGRWQAQIVLLANQPKRAEQPKIVRDAKLEENVDNYLVYGVGDHGLAQRLVLSSMSTIPVREKLPSARRSGGKQGVGDRPRFVPPPPLYVCPLPPAPPMPIMKPLLTTSTPAGNEPLTVSAAVPVLLLLM